MCTKRQRALVTVAVGYVKHRSRQHHHSREYKNSLNIVDITVDVRMLFMPEIDKDKRFLRAGYLGYISIEKNY